jgi:hypothetical protein
MVAVLFTSEDKPQLINSGVVAATFFPSSSVPRTTNNGKSKLPQNFLPSPHAVICGRGKACSSSPGNKSLRRIINSYIKPYSKARNKLEKSAIVSSIVGSIKQAAPNGAFVKFEGGMWWEVEDGVAREKVGCLLRDSLHTLYRSSTKAKLARRRAKNKGAGDELSLNSSSNHSSYGYSMNNSNHSHSYSSVSSADLNNSRSSLFNNSSSSLFSFAGLAEEILEPVSTPSSCFMTMIKQREPEYGCEQESSRLPIEDFYANCSLFEQSCTVSPGPRSSNFNNFRDIMPSMSAHLDIMGRGRNEDNFSSFNMEEEDNRRIPKALQQACDLLASFESFEDDMDDMDLPDDISNIFD